MNVWAWEMVRCAMSSKISFAREVSASKRVTEFRLTAIDLMVLNHFERITFKEYLQRNRCPPNYATTE